MGRFSRDEIEEAFQNYQRVELHAGTTGDWDAWADLFTEDATLVEHHYGTFGGREAMRTWINKVMHTALVSEMKYFPVEWYVIDDERGWVVLKLWNRMADPGDGSLHQASLLSLLKYAGEGKWSYEEDIYNPDNFQKMFGCWKRAKEEIARSS